MFVRVLRWWLPWLLVFGVSTALAYAADEAISGRAAPPLETDVARPSGRWMRIRSTGPDGQSVHLLCRLQPSLIGVDEIVLAWDDVHEFVTDACEEVQTDRTD